MNAADIMTPDVITVQPDTPLDQVVTLLLDSRVSGVPVVHRGSLVGIISEGDLMRRAELGTQPRRSHLLEALAGASRLAAEYARTHGRKASEVMTTDVIAVEDITPIATIARLLETHRIKRVPVLRGGKLVGIVSRADLLRALADRLQVVPPPLPDDRRSRMTIYDELRRHKWGARVAQLNVTAVDGVVTLWGLVNSEEQRVAIRVIAENIPGVKQVDDHLENLAAAVIVPIA